MRSSFANPIAYRAFLKGCEDSARVRLAEV